MAENSVKYSTVYEGYNGYTIENPFEEVGIPEEHKFYVFSGWLNESGELLPAGEQYTDDAEALWAVLPSSQHGKRKPVSTLPMSLTIPPIRD